MSSKARQSDLREFRHDTLVITDGQRVCIEAPEPGTDSALILPNRFPLVTGGDRLQLVSEEGDWARTVNVTETEFLQVTELAEYITSNEAFYWAFTDRAILWTLNNIYGHVGESDMVLVLLLQK